MKPHSSDNPSGQSIGAVPQNAAVPSTLDVVLRSLATAIVAALSTTPTAAGAGAAGDATFQVTNCADAGPGSLRQALIDGESPISVGACAQISLVSGELAAAGDTVFISGSNTLITASGTSRVLSHSGKGTLRLEGLELAGGAVSGVRAVGGCVASEGEVQLLGTTVRDCTVSGTLDPVNVSQVAGGGVHARGNVFLDHSIVRDNTVTSAMGMYSSAEGGGVFAGGDLSVLHGSTISGNTVDGASLYCAGGGAVARGAAYVSYSTIDANTAPNAGGLSFGNGTSTSTIVNSTISGNGDVGIASQDSLLRVWNSTVAFNQGGVLLVGMNAYVALRSSILANNDRDGAADDLASILPVTVFGSNNIVITSNLALPADTIAADPLLAPLADNGGTVRTHALRANSPAIDHGDNVALKIYDARGEHFDRVVNSVADIGAYEVQPAELDVLFANGFEAAVETVGPQRQRGH